MRLTFLSYSFSAVIRYVMAFAGLAGMALQGASVSGSVYDAHAGAVAGAAVLLVAPTGDAQWSAQSDAAGHFRFGDVRPGEYLLQVHAPGFADYQVAHLQVGAAAEVTKDVHLDLSAVQQEISVTASSTPQAVDQVSKALTVIDKSSIQERQDITIPEAIRLAPGVRFDQEGGPGSLSEIRIRGLEPWDTAVLVDGMRLRDPAGTQADASSLLEDFLVVDPSRVEILRGSGSSLYGTNAVGGVVNVITDPGGGATHGSVQVEGGSLGLFRGSAVVAGGMKNDRFEYSAGISHLNVTEGVEDASPARTSSVQGRLGYRLTPTTQIIARFFGSDGFSILTNSPVALLAAPQGVQTPVALTQAQISQYYLGSVPPALGDANFIPSVPNTDYHRSSRYETGALSLLGQPAASLGYAVDYQVVNSTRTYEDGPAGFGYQPLGIQRSDDDGRTQTVNARVNYQAGKYNLLTAGYEFENENLQIGSRATPDNSGDSFTNAAQTSNTAFGQDQIRLFGDRLYVSLGFRAQFFSLQAPSFTPAGAAPYQGAHFAAPPAAYTGDGSLAYLFRRSGTKLRAHVGRAYRAPSLFERFGAGYDPLYGYTVYGDPELRPEQSIAVDAGVEQSLLNNKLRLSGTYFYTRVQRSIVFDLTGLIDPATDPWGRFIGYLDTNGRFSRGVEVSAEWAVNRSLTVSGAYTYTDVREETPLVPGVYQGFMTPPHQFTVFAVQRVGKNVFVDFALNAADHYVSEVFTPEGAGAAFQFAGQKRADLGASYRIPVSDTKALRLFAKGQNLFNQNYYENGFVTPGATARGGLAFEF